MRSFKRLFPIFVLALLFGACALLPGGEGSAEPDTLVEVENDLIPGTTLSVYAVSETGTRNLLGNVPSSETATLRMERVNPGEYHFTATTTSGKEIVSTPIVIGRGDAVVWNLSTNIVTPL